MSPNCLFQKWGPVQIDPLAAALDDPHEKVRHVALGALLALEPLPQSVWLRSLGVPDVVVRNAAVRSLRASDGLSADDSAEVGRVAAALEEANFRTWQNSDCPRDWVNRHDGRWTPDDERRLIETLWPIRSDDVKRTLEELKERHVPHAVEYIEKWISYMAADCTPEYRDNESYIPENAWSVLECGNQRERYERLVKEKGDVRAIPHLCEALRKSPWGHEKSYWVEPRVKEILRYVASSAFYSSDANIRHSAALALRKALDVLPRDLVALLERLDNPSINV